MTTDMHLAGSAAILSLLSRASATPVKVAELATELQIKNKDLPRLRKLLGEMVAAGSLAQVARGQYALAARPGKPARAKAAAKAATKAAAPAKTKAQAAAPAKTKAKADEPARKKAAAKAAGPARPKAKAAAKAAGPARPKAKAAAPAKTKAQAAEPAKATKAATAAKTKAKAAEPARKKAKKAAAAKAAEPARPKAKKAAAAKAAEPARKKAKKAAAKAAEPARPKAKKAAAKAAEPARKKAATATAAARPRAARRAVEAVAAVSEDLPLQRVPVVEPLAPAPDLTPLAPVSPDPAPPVLVQPVLVQPALVPLEPAPPEPAPRIVPSRTGRLSVHPAGYGFVELEDGSDDVFVPAKYRGAALDGDRVELDTWTGYKGIEGRVVRIISRGRAKLTGTLRRAGRSIYLQPDDPRIANAYGIVPLVDGAVAGKVGQAVVVEICHYPTDQRPELLGRLVRILGNPDDPRTEIEKIITCADIPTEFPAEALAQSDGTPQELGIADLPDRIDLRDRPFMTIDPEDARDFDDALCIEDGPRGTTRVWVAVADVSHYVRTDDALDREASIRGVSVYLPDRVIPMLPMALSAGICSLNPDEDRCAMVVRLDYSRRGALVDTGFAAAVIRSHARLDYPGVAAALSGDFRGRRMIYRRWHPALERLHALAQILRERRLARGALDLDIPEAKVILDADDPLLVRDVVRSKGNEDVRLAYQLVEEYMIAANEAVGAFFQQRELTAVWRVHAPPEAERLHELALVLKGFGIDLDVDEAVTPQGLRDVLKAVADKPAARSLSFLLLRSLKQAIYDVHPIGHFGLASSSYLHFTSPIRRYPDLLVHRLLKAELHREGQASGGAATMTSPPGERLAELAAAVSQHERRALEAEREAVSMYRAYIMRDQVGEEFAGKISAVTHFGVFVELDEPFIEGLIKIEDIGDDRFDYDDMAMRIRGRHSGLTLTLGDVVQVQVSNVSVPLRRVDLRLLSVRGQPAPRRSERSGDRPGDRKERREQGHKGKERREQGHKGKERREQGYGRGGRKERRKRRSRRR